MVLTKTNEVPKIGVFCYLMHRFAIGIAASFLYNQDPTAIRTGLATLPRSLGNIKAYFFNFIPRNEFRQLSLTIFGTKFA